MTMCCVFLLFIAATAQPASDRDISLDTIRSAHEERLRMMETLSISWTEKRTYIHIDDEERRPKGIRGHQGAYSRDCSLTIKGASARLELGNPYGDNGEEKPGPSPLTLTYHKEEGRELYRDHPGGIIHIEDIVASTGIVYQPLYFAYTVKPRGLFHENLSLLRTQTVGGRALVVIGNTDYNGPRSAGARWEYHLDPGRGFLPVRYVCMMPDAQIVFDVSVDYEERGELGFVPVKLGMVAFSELNPTVVNTIVELDIV